MTRTAMLRAAVVPLLATLLGLAPMGLIASAQAAPRPVAADPSGDATDQERPVRIDVGRFEPRALTPGALVTVTGTLTNTGDSTITDLGVRLQRGEIRTTRAELAAATADPDPSTTVQPPFQEVDGELPPGGHLEFRYTVGSDALQLDRDGVYPVLLNLNGTMDGDDQRVGELPTFLVQLPVVPSAATAVGWLWPLTDRSHRGPTGEFLDDGLADSIADDGRLDRALGVVERLPGTPSPGAGQTVPAVPVTLAVDPALVEELTLMASGPYAVGGVDGAGHGTEAAATFLERVRAVAAVHPVVALPYGDVDADSLDAAGLSDVIVRSLPGSPQGTAQDPLPDEEQDGADATFPPADDTGAVPAEPATDDISAGARILTDALDVDPVTDLAWAAGGSLRPETLRTLQSGGVGRVVVGSAGLSHGEAAVGLAGNQATAHTTLTTESGPVETLVADRTLSEIVGSAEESAGGARMAEQRYLAELAALTLQAPPGTEQTVLVAPPRNVDAGPEGVGAMMADTALGLPWLRPSGPDELFGLPAAPAGDLAVPGDATALDPAGMADVIASVANREDLAGAVVGDADTALQAYDAAIARAGSVAWRTDAEGFRNAAHALRAAMDHVRSQVTLLAPADGTYSLGSSDAPLVLTVRNDLPIAVQVLLKISTRGGRGLSIADIGVQTLAPGQRTTLQVPTKVRQSGGFAVTAQLTTPDGGPLGDRISMQVKSTAYGSISLIITIGAAVLLGLLFLRRLVNFLLRRRRAAVAPDLGAPEGTTGALPPNRSPV
jgi:hypothetical protein